MIKIWSLGGAADEYLTPDMVTAMISSQARSIRHADITTGVASITGPNTAILVSSTRRSALLC